MERAKRFAQGSSKSRPIVLSGFNYANEMAHRRITGTKDPLRSRGRFTRKIYEIRLFTIFSLRHHHSPFPRILSSNLDSPQIRIHLKLYVNRVKFQPIRGEAKLKEVLLNNINSNFFFIHLNFCFRKRSLERNSPTFSLDVTRAGLAACAPRDRVKIYI